MKVHARHKMHWIYKFQDSLLIKQQAWKLSLCQHFNLLRLYSENTEMKYDDMETGALRKHDTGETNKLYYSTVSC